MLRQIKYAMFIVATALLVACGGGGGGSSGPVASTLPFNLLATYISTYTTTSSNPFTVSGTQSGNAVGGSGTATYGAVTSGTFEGVAANQRTVTTTGTGTINGQNFSLAGSTIAWSDSNYMPKGESGGSEYIVVTTTAVLPTAAHVNDTGTAYTANRYTNSTKSSQVGTVTYSYVVEADTATTALVTLIATYKNMASVTTKVASSQLRITQSNTFTKIKETLNDYANNQVLTLTY